MADTTPAPAQPDLVTRLSAFALDLTALAARGELLTAYGRDREVGELVASLTAPSGLFPALVGEARVGKTAVCFCQANFGPFANRILDHLGAAEYENASRILDHLGPPGSKTLAEF
jgi:hypothetical protein